MGKHDRVENGLDLDEGAPASNSRSPSAQGVRHPVHSQRRALVPVLALLIVGMVMALQQGAIVEELSRRPRHLRLRRGAHDGFVRHVRHPGHPTAARQTASHGPDRRGHDRHPHPRILCDMMLSGLTPDLIPTAWCWSCSSRYRATWTRR
ncbi:MAG: hypothetical protein ACLSVD_10400 [Eggerthellaceae bacterium]